MTAPRRDGGGSSFGMWIRRQPDLDSLKYSLSVQDIDWTFHRFAQDGERGDSIMLVESKTYMKEWNYAQRDTLRMLDQGLRKATMRNGKRIQITVPDPMRPGHVRKFRYFGLHLLQFSKNNPDDSNMKWDHGDIDKAALLEILKFERDPDSIGKMLDRRYHHRLSKKESAKRLQSDLFDDKKPNDE